MEEGNLFFCNNVIKFVSRTLSLNLDHHMREVIRGGFVSFVVRIAGSVLGFLVNVSIARLLGAEGAGVYFLSVSIVMFAAVIGRMGLENTVVRFIAESRARENWEGIKGVYFNALTVSLITSSAVSLGLYLLSPVFADHVFHKPGVGALLKLMALATVPLALGRLNASSFRGLKQIFEAQLTDGVVLSLIMLLCIYPLVKTWGANGAAVGYLIASILACLLAVLLFFRANPRIRTVVGTFPFSRLFSSCLPLLWVTISSFLMGKAAVIVLGVWSAAREVAIYNVAHRTALLMTFGLYAVVNILSPKFTELIVLGDRHALSETARRSVSMLTVLAVPLFLVFTIFPRQIMGLFGSEFREGWLVLVIMAVSQFINVATGPAGELLIMGGHERSVRQINMTALMLNLLFCFFLIPNFGSIGAAWAVAIAYVIQALFSVVLVNRHFGFIMLPITVRKRG